MNAAVVHSFDSPPRYTAFAEPVAAEGEVVVQVIAAGLHPIVKALASGTHYGSTGELPFIPGVDGVGRLPDGTPVFFGLSRSPFGTFAERGLTARRMCLPLPEGLDPVTAAGLANPSIRTLSLGTNPARTLSASQEDIPRRHGGCRSACGTNREAPGCAPGGCRGAQSKSAGEAHGTGSGRDHFARSGPGILDFLIPSRVGRCGCGCRAGLSLGPTG